MNALLILLIILILLTFAVTGSDGFRNLIGLGLNLVTIFALILLISWQFNAILVIAAASVILLAFTIFMSSDNEQVTGVAFKTSVIVVFGLGCLALLVQWLGAFQGFSIEDMEELEGLSVNVGVNYSDLAVVVMVISMLGAVAEAAMAVTADLSELIEQNPNISLVDLAQQRLTLSQQILGTSVNTLLFGLLGSSVGLVLWYVNLHYSLATIMNSKLLMADVAAMLLGFLGILLAIWLAGYFIEKGYAREKAEV